MSKVRIRLKAYDHKVLDDTASKIVTTIKRIGGEITSSPLNENFKKLRNDISISNTNLVFSETEPVKEGKEMGVDLGIKCPAVACTSDGLIRFYGNGSVTLGNKTVTVTDRGADQYIDIDCEMMTCSNGSSNLSSHVTLSNGYPVIAPGGSGIEYTTDSSVENPCRIMPRWWEV